MKRVAMAVILGAMAVGSSSASSVQKTADLQKVMVGVWIVDQKAQMEASPLYALSTPEKKKELEKQFASMPPTKVEFKAASWGFVGDKMVPFKILKSGPKSLVIDTTDPVLGGKDQLTLEYVSDNSLRMTMKSQGMPLTLTRSK